MLNIQIKNTLDRLNEIIEASYSDIAPSNFLKNELRRMVVIHGLRYLSDEDGSAAWIGEKYVASMKQSLEEEYLCYHDFERFSPLLKNKSNIGSQIYASCNSQIEYFLKEFGMFDFLKKINIKNVSVNSSVNISDFDLQTPLRRYLIGTGNLFPIDEKNLVIHPNMFFIQINPWRYGSDHPFLSRDLVRCPYLYWNKFSDKDMWNYWVDLVSLSAAENIDKPVRSSGFRPESFYNNQELTDSIKQQLLLGHKLVPTRYNTLEAETESFDFMELSDFLESL
ncbi:MAG: hypothetical protein ABIC91_03765 [Nanoarchaeota archaeon]|nr:hypothetical protein [Nanoarchaeota archaeon]MBU1030450.1 hypothetical protein [Nanoarchaeota archaeon]MBU1849479.1 hypothetical protein [Nanoarchaeota archaeon]